MKQCPVCGHQNSHNEMRCPECGRFYSKIIELIDELATEEENASVAGRWKRFLATSDKKQALYHEWLEFKSGLSFQAKLSLWMIFVFVFALIVTVL